MNLRLFSILMAAFSLAGNLAADDLTTHGAPQPLAAGAQVSDWPRFLGPTDNATSPETKLLKSWEASGPAKVWELSKGIGHACPAIRDGKLVLFHRLGTREVVDCRQAETGKPLWSFTYEAPYRDSYGAGDGPRTNPVIAGDRVFVFGITGWLHCLELSSGKVLWKHDLESEYELGKTFFGHGSTPLVAGERLIINLGGKNDACVAAFSTSTGKQLWTATHPWGASYASPIAATIHGRDCVLVFAGGQSRPATGGLLCLEAATGAVLSATPHRADIVESVSASSPVVIGNRVFVSEAYGSGGLMVEFAPDFSAKTLWQSEKFGTYFMTAIARDGFLFGFDGQQSRLTELVCYEVATGREVWRNDLGGKFQRGSLLAVDGAFLCLGENGTLAWLELSEKGAKVLAKADLFQAPSTWTLPALSHGLLYVCQNEPDNGGHPRRLICYDLRGR